VKPLLLKYLACPSCHGDLKVEGTASYEVSEGALACMTCAARYPVRGGIPRFPITGDIGRVRVTKKTSEMYKFAWEHFGKSGYEQGWEKDSYRFTSMIPADLTASKGRVGLDAGCGAGLDLAHFADGGADIIAIDVSTGVEVAKDLLRDRPNVHFVQGDLHSPPFRPDSFDFVYSFGVLHHMADTRQGFLNLASLLKVGGPLITYLYESFDKRSALEQRALSAVGVGRAATVKMPATALYALCWMMTPLVWLTCSVPARLLRTPLPSVAAKIPYRHTVRWNVLASDLFDRFSPPVERRFTEDQVRELYSAAGLGDLHVEWYRGWVAWGRKPGPSQ
jgi:SAM-dependent methyltransferase/uncharacterized protein YbaR (Trm112 family)